MGRRTVWVKEDTYEMLKGLKMHPRETFDDVIRRLLEWYAKCLGEGREKGDVLPKSG